MTFCGADRVIQVGKQYFRAKICKCFRCNEFNGEMLIRSSLLI